MKIGILSDTHNNIKLARAAVDKLKKSGVELILHAGDITSPKILKIFAGTNTKFVLGNCDIDIDELNAEARTLGFGEISAHYTLLAGGKRILLFHGDNVPLFREAVELGRFDYIVKGHTHSIENYVRRGTRVINPGSLNNMTEGTAAILDTESDTVEIIHVSVKSNER